MNKSADENIDFIGGPIINVHLIATFISLFTKRISNNFSKMYAVSATDISLDDRQF